jgi:drug/metabolite transporter (DMT)-like permease
LSPLVIFMVLSAAVMHAIWNAVVKVDGDRLMTMTVAIGTTGLLAPFLLLLGPSPAPESWPYIVASTVLNNIYFLFLIEAYRVGDLSHAYPLARGSAPLMVAIGAMVFGGERLGVGELAGIALVSGGTISLIFGGGLQAGWRPIVFPLLTGLMIATYTVIDGIGVRLSGSPWGYIGWLFILSPLPLSIIAIVRRGSGVFVFLRARWRRSVLAGVLSMASYGLAIWALTFAAMAHVSALRETSVIMAALIGSRVLGEAFGRKRIISATIVFIGVVTISLSAAY